MGETKVQTVEQLQVENDKLQGRLKKAITVFTEQKENIARLTSEKEELSTTLKAKEERIAELETKLKEKDQQDNEFFDLTEENDKLRDSVKELNACRTELNDQLEKMVVDNENLSTALKAKDVELKKSTDTISKSLEYIKEVKDNYKDFVEQLIININALSQQSDLISKKISETKIF